MNFYTTNSPNLLYSYNENILIYNGNILPDSIRNNVTTSIENLMDRCMGIYDSKIYRSNNCIWYILSINIPEYSIASIIQNILAKSHNNEILKDALLNYPTILQNRVVANSNPVIINLLSDISYILANTVSINTDFDINLLDN